MAADLAVASLVHRSARLLHQVINNGDQPRISLAMGFIHPQLSSAKVEGGAYSAWTGRLQ